MTYAIVQKIFQFWCGGGGNVDYGKTAGGPGCRSQLYGQDPGAKKSNMIN